MNGPQWTRLPAPDQDVPQLVFQFDTVPCNAAPCYAMPRDILCSFYTFMLCFVMLYCAFRCHVVLQYATQQTDSWHSVQCSSLEA